MEYQDAGIIPVQLETGFVGMRSQPVGDSLIGIAYFSTAVIQKTSEIIHSGALHKLFPAAVPKKTGNVPVSDGFARRHFLPFFYRILRPDDFGKPAETGD